MDEKELLEKLNDELISALDENPEECLMFSHPYFQKKEEENG